MYLPQAMPEAVQAGFPFDLAARAGSAIRIGEDSAAVLADLVVLNAAAAVCPVPVRILAGGRDLVVRNDLHGPRLAAMLPEGAFTPLPGLGQWSITSPPPRSSTPWTRSQAPRREPPSGFLLTTIGPPPSGRSGVNHRP